MFEELPGWRLEDVLSLSGLLRRSIDKVDFVRLWVPSPPDMLDGEEEEEEQQVQLAVLG